MSGGNDNTQFYASLSYMKQTGIFANQGMERFTGNANLTHKFGRFVLTYSSLFTKMNQSLTSDGGASYGNPIANYAFMQSPHLLLISLMGRLLLVLKLTVSLV